MMKGTEHGPSLVDFILRFAENHRAAVRRVHTAYNDVLDEAEYAAAYGGDLRLSAREIGRHDAQAEKGD